MAADTNETALTETVESNTDSDIDSNTEQEIFVPTFRNYLLSYLTTQADNIFLSFYNRTIVVQAYATTNLDIMWHNITNPWVWDDDEFNINQAGHPYQGSMYFQGARANGLNFYESLAVAAFGSLTWELLMENETPSFNDIIITPVQGALFGEVLHRIYLDTTGKIPVLPALIAPQSALNHFITGTPCPNNSHSHIQVFTLGAGAGLYNTFKNNSNPLFERLNNAQIDLNVILKYGDVYSESTFVPLESFSLDAIGGLNFPSTYLVFLNGDGLLLSFIPDFKNPTALSLDMLYQYYEAFGELNFSNNALGATIQQKININDDTSIEWKEQLQFAYLTGYDCHYLLVEGEGKRRDPYGREQRLYDLGIGIANSAGFTFNNPTIGNFKLDTYAGIYKTIPVTVQTEGSDGFSMIEYISLDYEHKIYKNLYFAVNSLFYFRQAFYDDLENYTQFTNNTTAFVRYKFL
ncbi:MAG: DUF3943 domain-containing protein [Treponema sp.]|nr:DUF3943 domain-containing protein [Treponema sp.]